MNARRNPISESDDGAPAWNPFEESYWRQRRTTRRFQKSSLREPRGREASWTFSEWSPQMRVTEDSHQYIIKAELHDLRKDDVKIHVESGVITLSGEHTCDREANDETSRSVEGAHGGFRQSLDLPEDADPEKMSAEFKDGVLSVRLPKYEHATVKAVDVMVS